MYWNKEFVQQIGKKDYHYIKMDGQPNLEITKLYSLLVQNQTQRG